MLTPSEETGMTYPKKLLKQILMKQRQQNQSLNLNLISHEFIPLDLILPDMDGLYSPEFTRAVPP